MIFTNNTTKFKKLADLFDPMYLELENKGYDLAELEAIHVTTSPIGGGNITLIFDINTMPTATFNYEKDDAVDTIINS